ncbi:hypothetical protein LL033_00415 [Clostridium estertheticum]|nr:hypothetical protein [Clostridium estertheticum]MBU3218063.1 hypothetical protein [Clostridium estertheticum]WAG55731.1 hypothetical protein LL033_00415 [Clostridium estertheticum]
MLICSIDDIVVIFEEGSTITYSVKVLPSTVIRLNEIAFKQRSIAA